MITLVPAVNFLYLHKDSAADLYLETFRKGIASIPEGLLLMEPCCRPIITNRSDPRESQGITIGWGFHHSDFQDGGTRAPNSGLVFAINPPYVNGIDQIKMRQDAARVSEHSSSFSSFRIGEQTFLLTDRNFDLDTPRGFGYLKTKEIYQKPGRAVAAGV